MDDPDIAAFARRWHMPLADAQRFAAAVARRCGVIAETIELPGVPTFETLALVESLGRQVNAAIALEFPDPDGNAPPARGPNWLGIGGPSKL
jgi:hypothetical protein